MAEVLRLKNPVAYELMDVRDLFYRAFAKNAPVDAETAIAELTRLAAHPGLAVFLGREDGRYQGLAIAMLPSSPLFPAPQCWHFFNDGSNALRENLIRSVVEFSLENGYSSLRTIDANDKAGAFKRLFKSAGPARRIAAVYEFDLSAVEGKDDERSR